MFDRHQPAFSWIQDGADRPEVEIGDLRWTNENATETRNVLYKWSEPLHMDVDAELGSTNLDIVKNATIVAYLLTFVVGFTGNTLVLYVVGRFPVVRRKSVANYYIWNLALADELYVLALPLFCWATYRSATTHTYI